MKKLTDTQKKWAMTGGLLSALAFNVSFLGNQVNDYTAYSTELASETAVVAKASDSAPVQAPGVEFIGGKKANITYVKQDDKTTRAMVMWLDSEGKVCADCDAELLKLPIGLKADNIKDLNKAIEAQLFEVRRKEKPAAKTEDASKADSKKEAAASTTKAEEVKPAEKAETAKAEETVEAQTKEEIRRDKIVLELEKLEKRCKADLECKVEGIQKIADKDKNKDATKEIKSFVNSKIKPMLVSSMTMPALTISGYEDPMMLEQMNEKRRTEQSRTIELIRSLSRGMVSYDNSIASEIAPLATLAAKQDATDAFYFNQQAQLKADLARRTNDPRLQSVYLQAANANQNLALNALNDFRNFDTSLRSGLREDVMGWQSDNYITYPTAMSMLSNFNTEMDKYTLIINSIGQNSNSLGNLTNQQNRLSPLNVNPTVGNLNQNQVPSNIQNPGVYFGSLVQATPQSLNQRTFDWGMRFQRAGQQAGN